MDRPRSGGRHFLQIPGPTNVPERVLRAIDAPAIDHRGPDFPALTREILAGLASVFQTAGDVAVFPGSGTGAWEAALVNTLSPGDRVLMFETGQFAATWHRMARDLGLEAELVPGDWRSGVAAEALEARLRDDSRQQIAAVAVVHNETSTGVTTGIADLGEALRRTGHRALLLVDAISSVGSLEYRHDAWGVDVTVAGCQKGLMLPPGLAFNAISPRARAAAQRARLPKSYWRWEPVLEANRSGSFPYTPATNLLYGLREALRMLHEEGLPQVFARHARLAEATRRAVAGWGLELQCRAPHEYSHTVSAVRVPEGHDADALRKLILERYDLSLGTGLGKLAGRVFRIGHMGHLNDLMLAGTLCGVEMGLAAAGVPHAPGGVRAALAHLSR
jgi:alanine-glyoxylate transaminase/serine-glyoxylate transaminase/serine-pyruvate transaminase